MARIPQVVITGYGVISPLGVGREAVAEGVWQQQSGVGVIRSFDSSCLPVPIAGEISDFEPKNYVRPRKSLKVMSRDIQLGFAAANMALEHAGIPEGQADPDRMGVVFGADMIYFDPVEITEAYRRCLVDGWFEFARWGEHAMGDLFPLWMLKYLPNMTACHIAIGHDARAANNSIVLGEVSFLLALAEASRLIERGQADVVISGATSCRINPNTLSFRFGPHLTGRIDTPEQAMRPFDADRDGMVYGEGAAAFVLESAEHAKKRGGTPLARVASHASHFANPTSDGSMSSAIGRSIEQALAQSGVSAKDVGHVNAHGISMPAEDAQEATAIRTMLGDVPVTAPKSYMGNLGAATGAVELVWSLLALESGSVPVTLNYQTPDPACDVRVVRDTPLTGRPPVALLLNQTLMGQSVATVITAAE